MPASPFRSLVTIQKGSAEHLPFFCVHGAGGNVLNFRDMSLAMGRSQPFYALQARGIDGVLAPHETIEEMASAYLAEVRAVQPTGPYVFGGYSGGGLVAFEMAQQVLAAGGSVALVLLLDTIPTTGDKIAITMNRRIRRMLSEPAVYLRTMVTRRLADRKFDKRQQQINRLLANGETIPSDLRETRMETSFATAAGNYVPRPFAGRVLLLRADVPHFLFDALGPTYGWDQIVGGGVEILRVPGDHQTLVLEPNASTLVRVLRDTLDGILDLGSPSTRSEKPVGEASADVATTQ
jgi:thioesterase domain-containing protein